LIFWCFNATFSNISAISWRPVLVVEETEVPGENHRPWDVLNGFGENTVEYNYHSNLFGGSSQKWIFSLVHNHKY
jgi:hypothetical protein